MPQAIGLRAPEFTILSNESSSLLGEASYHALGLTMDALTPKGMADYNRRTRRDWKTFKHETRVGGLLWAVSGDPIVTVSGTKHDAGKGRKVIQALMGIDRYFTDEERQIMGQHAAFGEADLQGAIADPEMAAPVRRAAGNHHTLRPDSFSDAYDQYLWDVTSLVQVADRAESMLIDWDGEGRLPYKADRMTREGLISRETGKVVMDKMVATVLDSDAGKTYLGVSTDDVLDLALACMPSADEIQAGVLAIRAQTN